jgi:hypothetical protein
MKMKLLTGIGLSAILSCQTTGIMAQESKAEQFVKSATIRLKHPIERVFPLFGAYEEKKWAENWKPVPVYPRSEQIQEGTVFQTTSHVPGEPMMIWTVTKYDTILHEIQYIIHAANRIVLLDIVCVAADGGQTNASIRYMLTGLSGEGNEISAHLIHRIYANDLTDWRDAIEKYLNSEK